MNEAIDPVAYDTLWSGQWDDMRVYGPMARHSRRLMRSLTRDLSPQSILDVGCGEGSLLKALAGDHPGAALGGIELSDNALHLARRTLPGAAFSALDVASTKLPQAFDLVVSADVVEHIDDDVAALRNMTAMTNPGGHVVVATLQGRMREFERGIGHVRNYATGELQDKMTAAGLVVERVVEWGWPLYSPLYRDLLDTMDNRGTGGKFGLGRKLICHALYALFMVNRSAKGDYIFVRAHKPEAEPGPK
ncbi:MAG: class I SAM-dependent methyltransferase [Rhodobacteraceae bacterium]|nr:class I SAM-dependent methyltransferase [Paracoccaceae bacterium]